MFKITPIQTGEEQERLLSLCGSHAKKGQFSYLMFDLETGAPMGVSQFEILGKDGVLSALLCHRFGNQFVICRVIGQ